MFICKFHRKPEDLAAARVPRSYHFCMVPNQNHSFGHIGRRRREAIWSGAWVVLVVGTEHVKHFWLGKIPHLNVLTWSICWWRRALPHVSESPAWSLSTSRFWFVSVFPNVRIQDLSGMLNGF